MSDSLLGGKKILQRVAGKDASKQFWKYHNESILKKYKKQLLIGSLDTKPKAPEPKPEANAAPVPAAPTPKAVKAVEKEVAAKEEEAEALEPFGDQIPFADPAWYQSVRLTWTIPLVKSSAYNFSTTHPTSTNLMLLCAPRSANG